MRKFILIGSEAKMFLYYAYSHPRRLGQTTLGNSALTCSVAPVFLTHVLCLKALHAIRSSHPGAAKGPTQNTKNL
eukprot:g5864.t1